MRWFALLLIFSVCAPLAAQDPIPDTTEAWRYFPLEIGNVWEYWVEITLTPPDCFPSCVRYSVREVVGDSTIGENVYSSIHSRILRPDGSEVYTQSLLVRFDTLSAQVRVWGSGSEQAYGGLECRLDAPFPTDGSYLPCEGPDSYVTGEGYDQPVEIADESVLVSVKSFEGVFSEYFRFAADIGLVRNTACEISCTDYQLIYAQVGGTEFGTPSGVAVEPEGAVQRNLAMVAYPNPALDRFSISLSSSKSQQVAADIFDLLGRRVYSEQRVIPAGTTQLQLDGSNWPRGIFLVRVTTADGQTATARITRQ